MLKITLLSCCICILISGCINRNSQDEQKNSDVKDVKLAENELDELDRVYYLDFEKQLKNIKKDTFTINSIF